MAKYKISDVAPIKQGIVKTSEEYWLLNLDMVERNSGNILNYLYVGSNELGSSTIAFDVNNVLYSKLRPYLNKVVLPTRSGYATSEMIPLYPNTDIITREYLTYFLRSPHFVSYINEKTSGAKMPRVNIPDLMAVEVECPSIKKQKKITDIFDKIISVKNFQQQELQKLDDLVKARFVEMFGDPIQNPKGWNIVTIGDIISEVRYGTSKPAVEGGKYPYLRMNNMSVDGRLDLRDLKYIDIPDEEIEKCVVRKGDVLFNRTNSIELVGKTAAFDLSEEMIIAGYIIRIRLKERLLPEVLVQYMNHMALKDILRTMAKGAVNQANINAQELQTIKVYVPNIELQKKFVVMKNQVDKTKTAIQTALNKTQQLYDSLMQEYFG